ncbi:TrkH family potassium uptake protein [Salinisphaera sp.]|uniref:TrkH family potassium uptake protein n=1 Tax=Salinisphaera sp. TaxID=1914330 RepID=UPI002D77CD3F|nr:TrkH family potassium uptake protein [Salinisphaera sp.]HET7314524.1 TrkH family potassium uptake protein [Salinisphaera sp.]
MQAFAWTAAAGFVLGQGLYWPARGHTPTQARHAMLIAALAWLAVSAVGTLPFIIGRGIPVINAMFESLSGFTGTGMSVLRADRLPHYLQWWRSLSQWIGGVGVIVLLLSILPPRHSALELYYSESREQKLLPSVRSTARAIWSIYVVYTGLGIGLLWLGQVPIWRAINQGMTAIATGGFAITGDSLMSSTPLAKLLYLPIMIAGAIGFYAHYHAVRERRPIQGWFGSSEQKLFWFILVLGALALAANNFILYRTSWLDSVLQWVSAATTTGFQSASLAHWHPGALFMMSLVMLVGATAGSTGGGLKMLRLVLLYKSIVWRLAEITRRPHEIVRLTFDGEALAKDDANSRVQAATTLTYGWFLVSATAVLVMTYSVPDTTPLQITIFDVFSAQSNVGLTAGLVGPSLSIPGKLTLMVVMWMGRLEIIPIMVLIAVALQRTTRKRI